MVSFDVSLTEAKIIAKIAKRAVTDKLVNDFQMMEMDITACHANGMPLDLEKLLAAKPADFGHDVLGIRRFIDRDTGEMGRCFAPRCCLPEQR